MIPKFRLWDKRFSEFVEDFFVSEAGKIYKKSTDTSYGIAISRETSDKVVLTKIRVSPHLLGGWNTSS